MQISKTKPLALLVNPPIYDFALYDLFLKPYGLLRIGAWLEAGGWDVRYVDGMDYTDPVSSRVLGRPKRKPDGTGKFHRRPIPLPEVLRGIDRKYARYGIVEEEFRRRLVEAGRGRVPDAVFLSTGMTYWYPGAGEAARRIRKVFPGVPFIAGGIYASLLPDHCRRTCGPDYIVPGDDIGGLRRFLSRRRLPVPAGSPDERALVRGMGPDSAILRLNYGCPRDCDYCASRFLCGGFSSGDPAAGMRAFESLYLRGIRNFAFYDDALLSSKEKVLKPFLREVVGFLEGVRTETGRVSFYLPNAVHINMLDYETAELMVRAGFRDIRFGFESASEVFHSQHGGKFELVDFSSALEICRRAGFPPEMIRVYILCGLPGQERQEVDESIEYCADRKVGIQLARYSPVPGTRLWPESVRKSRYPVDEEPLFQNNTFFSMEWEGFSRQDLAELKQKVERRNRELQASGRNAERNT